MKSGLTSGAWTTRGAVLAATAAFLLAGVGCAVDGRWELIKVEPDAARGDVEFQTFTLQDDGSYFAQTNDNGVETTSGTYSYDHNEGVLDLTDKNGGRHTYEAKVVEAGQKLHLERLWKGQKLKMVYEKRPQ